MATATTNRKATTNGKAKTPLPRKVCDHCGKAPATDWICGSVLVSGDRHVCRPCANAYAALTEAKEAAEKSDKEADRALRRCLDRSHVITYIVSCLHELGHAQDVDVSEHHRCEADRRSTSEHHREMREAWNTRRPKGGDA